MKRTSRAAAVVVALAALLALVAGCGGQGGSGPAGEAAPTGPLPDAATLQKAVTTATKNLHDVQLNLAVDGDIPNLPVKAVNGYLTNAPAVAAQGDADVIAFGSEVQAKFVVLDGILWAQLSGDKYTSMGKAADTYDPSVILDPNRGLGKIVESVRDLEVEGREDLNDQHTIRVSGIVPGSVIGVLAPKSHLGDLPCTFWVQEKAPNNLVQAHVQVGSALISMKLSHWGEKLPVTKPNG
ncbi:LppX_LprAFG lipoprotein [Tsukamurella sp. 8F]|uniref:LppX_LprAFG lipoprotein n=1 Tax=unclassified Tsukamurella TaxID=2633480 RepID=UPI0023B98561|nr:MULTISPECIES: LppX_LprAFG lipoprotein [unclassified Tsukamurella]MDF0529899.1 LppX_LprAFG lipoprotein [Tsukamurella sp. 8J]MDF0588646.1 LppX_LprAFG lipoprotein [Tsukamurella sp. 8F]